MILGTIIDERIPMTRDVNLTKRQSLEWHATWYYEADDRQRAAYVAMAKIDKVSASVLARLPIEIGD